MPLLTATERRKRLRLVFEGGACLHPASVFDPLSARAAEDLGFELGMLAGSVASLAVLGAPDWTLITLSELAGLVSRISRASDLPLLADADHGYGNALNVMRTVEELEQSGAAALSIEDSVLPTGYGETTSDRKLISIEEGAGKLRAAVAARRDSELFVLGRTNGPALVGLDACIARVQAYRETGIDGLFLVGLGGLENLEAVAAEAHLPLVVAGIGAPAEPARLAELGVRLALVPHLPVRAAIRAAYEVLAALRGGTAPEELAERVAAAELMEQLTRRSRYAGLVREFLES